MLIPPFEEVELRNYTEDGELRVEKKEKKHQNQMRQRKGGDEER